MLLSMSGSGSSVAELVGAAIAEHRPQDVDAPTRQSDEGLVVALALVPLALVAGAARRLVERAGRA